MCLADRPLVVGVAGCGNIGSHLVPLLARICGIGRLILCDKDVYSQSNLCSQGIEANDIGRPKVDVMADHLRRIAPGLRVTCFAAALADVPAGLLPADCWLGALDSNSARQDLNALAWHLGAVLIDGGVWAEGGLLGKIDIYIPSAQGPCLECVWDERIYGSLEQARPCGKVDDHPTNAPAALGALVAAIQALEVGKLAAGGRRALTAGRRIVIDASGHHLSSSRLPRNPRCRFDHETWSVRPLPHDAAAFPLARIVDLACGSGAAPVEIQVCGDAFVTALLCGSCGAAVPALALSRTIASSARPCPRCGTELIATGLHRCEWLDVGRLTPADGSRPLSELGVRSGDCIAIRSPEGVVRFVAGCPASDCA